MRRYGTATPLASTASHTLSAHATRPQRADARRNRERILEAARTVFAAHGGDAQIDDIARAAGVGVGTVYRHFPHKEALLGELLRQKFSMLADTVEQALEVEDPWESFAGMMRANAAICAKDVGVHQAVARGPVAWEYAAAELGRLRHVTTRMIDRAQAAGVMRMDFVVDDIPMLMTGLTATMGVAEYDWRRHLELLLAGLRVVA